MIDEYMSSAEMFCVFICNFNSKVQQMYCGCENCAVQVVLYLSVCCCIVV